MGINQVASDLYKALTESDERKPKAGDVKATVIREEGNTVWVKFPGGEDETPVQKTNNATIGDEVMVRTADGRAWILGNNTSPATDDTTANKAAHQAIEAFDVATFATASAEVAKTAADSALRSAETAQEAADRSQEILEGMQQAAEDADTTLTAIYQDAKRANDNADAAQASADESKNYAYMAMSQLGIVEDVVGVLELVAKNGVYELTSDETVTADKWYFTESYEYSIVETPTGNPNEQGWYEISEIEYGLSNDTEVSSGKNYYIRSGDDPNYEYTLVSDPTGNPHEHNYYEVVRVDYIPSTDTMVIIEKEYYARSDKPTYEIVNNPTGNPHENGWFELVNIDDAIKNYVSSHLVLTEQGLWIQHGEATTKALMSPTEGFVIYNNLNQPIAKYGEEAIIGGESGFHITISGTDNEIGFYQGDVKAAYINNQALYVENSLSFGQDSEFNAFTFYQRANGHFTLKLVKKAVG